ncbi:hypothetical protein L3X38_032770 [Prunus dulcis]|uniref:DUF4371 domain-containing protein n=1 Tax=Prunus dulcis TaxID=3755 RepID=A0AAD4VFU3_PRUDU|nr:hypothetical protein L3X38_032770 [Prunus dulcis]
MNRTQATQHPFDSASKPFIPNFTAPFPTHSNPNLSQPPNLRPPPSTLRRWPKADHHHLLPPSAALFFNYKFMERLFKRKLSTDSPSLSNPGSSNARSIEVDEILANLQADPGLRTRMGDYSPNIWDEIRRAYLQKGPCQPRSYKFPQTNQSKINRCFIAHWFDDHDWLEYSLSFRGHDESTQSSNKGNYLELLQFLVDHDEKVKAVVLENALGNLKLIAPSIQKDLVNSCAKETIGLILSDVKDRYFSIMVDEARDVSIKEKMAMVLRYVNDKGQIIERFVGVQHVTDTTSSALKEAIDEFFSSVNLSFSKLRGQGYDGASNMRALVAVAKKNIDVNSFFTTVNRVWLMLLGHLVNGAMHLEHNTKKSL